MNQFDAWMADMKRLLDQDGIVYKGEPIFTSGAERQMQFMIKVTCACGLQQTWANHHVPQSIFEVHRWLETHKNVERCINTIHRERHCIVPSETC